MHSTFLHVIFLQVLSWIDEGMSRMLEKEAMACERINWGVYRLINERRDDVISWLMTQSQLHLNNTFQCYGSFITALFFAIISENNPNSMQFVNFPHKKTKSAFNVSNIGKKNRPLSNKFAWRRFIIDKLTTVRPSRKTFNFRFR